MSARNFLLMAGVNLKFFLELALFIGLFPLYSFSKKEKKMDINNYTTIMIILALFPV